MSWSGGLSASQRAVFERGLKLQGHFCPQCFQANREWVFMSETVRGWEQRHFEDAFFDVEAGYGVTWHPECQRHWVIVLLCRADQEPCACHEFSVEVPGCPSCDKEDGASLDRVFPRSCPWCGLDFYWCLCFWRG
jgi:hypothetical protein